MEPFCTGAFAARHGRRRREDGAETLVCLLSWGGVLVFFVVIAALAVVLVDAALPALRVLGWGNSWAASRTPPPSAVFPPLLGTVLSAAIALSLAVPLSLAVALFVTEFAPRPLARRAGVVLEITSAVPSLVFGMWGLAVLLPFLGHHTVDPDGMGVVVSEGGGVVPAGLVLATMLLPSLTNAARRMLDAVPTSLREAAISLGATRWEVVRHMSLPHVRTRLAGAVLLGLGRALGEAMAVVLLIGNRAPESDGLPSSTLATKLLTELKPGTSELHASSLALLSLTLLLITLVVHAAGRRLVRGATRANGEA